jgi:hypothetical protein
LLQGNGIINAPTWLNPSSTAEHADNATSADKATLADALTTSGTIALQGDIAAAGVLYTSGNHISLNTKLDIKDGYALSYGLSPDPAVGQVLVYDGTKWVAGNISGATTLPYYPTVTDIDGNTYSIAQFGAAGWWMTENLRTTRYTDKTLIPQLPPLYYLLRDISDGLINSSADFWAYPFNANFYYSGIGLNGGRTTPEQVKVLGLQYTYVTSKKICPFEWHLPTKKEYEDLKDEIKNDFPRCKYSLSLISYSNFTGLTGTYNTTAEDAMIASIMLSPEDEYPESIQPDKANLRTMHSTTNFDWHANFTGISKSGREGGFAGKLAGAHDFTLSKYVVYVANLGFANIAYYWTDDAIANEDNAYTFNLICSKSGTHPIESNPMPETTTATFYKTPKQFMCSVRCKKDN